MSYSDKVIDHYNNPRNVGSMDKSSADVGTGLVGAPECGDAPRSCPIIRWGCTAGATPMAADAHESSGADVAGLIGAPLSP